MKRAIFAALFLLFTSVVASAADYRSSFGFPFSLPSDWVVLTQKTLSGQYKDTSFSSIGIPNNRPELEKQLRRIVNSGQAEAYFEKEYSNATLTNSIIVQLSPGALELTDANVKQACADLPKDAAAANQGRPVKVKFCGLKESHGIRYAESEYTVPGSNVTTVSRHIPYLVNGSLEIDANSNNEGLPTVARNSGNVVSSITRYLADEKKVKVPKPREQVALVRHSMHVVGIAVKNKDTANLFADISLAWRIGTNVKQLNQGFKDLMDKKVDLLALDDMTPQIQAAGGKDKYGVITVQGYYPTKPNKVLFRLSYIYEGPDWKLTGAGIHVRPAK